MNFSDRPPSKQWSALKYRGEPFAEVWFKPEGEPFGVLFRIPRQSFAIAGMAELLTAENLLNAIQVPTDTIDSWQCANEPSVTHFTELFSPPASEVKFLEIQFTVKPPAEIVVSPAVNDVSAPSVKLQELDARWKAILALEVSIDTLRQSMEAVQNEIENASKRVLTTEEKVNALNADVAQLNKAKTRVHHVQPKARDFIHRATWALANAERKKLEEFFKPDRDAEPPSVELDRLSEQLESLLKDRQILSAIGVTVYQECKNVAGDIRGALSTLQSNARSNAQKKRGRDRRTR